MGSKRLPGKILKEVNGIPLLKYLIRRVEKAKLIDKIIVATTNSKKDNPVVEFCNQNNVEYYRGSENDVLDRYYQTAKQYNPNIIVRITGDCPLHDPDIIDRTIKLFIDSKVDYAANTVPPEKSKFPDGSDVEVFSFGALDRAWIECKNPTDREHVTFYMWRYNNGFKTILLDNNKEWGDYRLTIDYPEDFEVIKFIINKLNDENKFGTIEEIIDILDSNPDIRKKNSKYYFRINWE